jgi:hypothetical protein
LRPCVDAWAARPEPLSRSIYSVRFAAVSGATSGITTLFTVPAAHTYILRQASVYCQATGGTAFLLDGTTGVPLLYTGAVAPGVLTSLAGSWVVPAGESVQLDIVGGTWGVLLSGYDLLAV